MSTQRTTFEWGHDELGPKKVVQIRIVLERSRAEGAMPRNAAEALARERVLAAMDARHR